MDKFSQFCVWGNPIAQSKSPQIQNLFAEDLPTKIEYSAKLGDKDLFEQQLEEFFQQGGIGCNVTAPFKQRAFRFAKQYSPRCLVTKAANTLMLLDNGDVFADNTDGIGLLTDLQRLNWLAPEQRILIIGAGGATQGIVYALLQAKQQITILNRSQANALAIQQQFADFGELELYSSESHAKLKYDFIINTIPNHEIRNSKLDFSFLSNTDCIYDLSYQTTDTNFIQIGKQFGVKEYYDGKGMLIYQAAHAFNLWWNQIPSQERIEQAFNIL